MASMFLQASNGLGIDLFLLGASFIFCVLAVLGFAHLARPRAPRAGSLPPPQNKAAPKAYLERNELF